MTADDIRRQHSEPSLRRVLLSFVAFAVVVVAAIFALRGRDGDPIATLDLTRGPADARVALAATDRLRVRADLEFRHRASQLRGDPVGCSLELALSEGDTVRAQTRCEFFSGVAVGGASSARWEPDGRVWRRLEAHRLDCEIAAPAAGTFTLRASSTLSRCVAQLIEARVTATR